MKPIETNHYTIDTSIQDGTIYIQIKRHTYTSEKRQWTEPIQRIDPRDYYIKFSHDTQMLTTLKKYIQQALHTDTKASDLEKIAKGIHRYKAQNYNPQPI